MWNITPQFPFVAYVLAGAGYAWANLDFPIAGESNGRAAVLTDSNGLQRSRRGLAVSRGRLDRTANQT